MPSMPGDKNEGNAVKYKILIVAGIVLALLLVPLSAAAVTNPDVVAILNAGITGLVSLVKLAYCASGIAALC